MLSNKTTVIGVGAVLLLAAMVIAQGGQRAANNLSATASPGTAGGAPLVSLAPTLTPAQSDTARRLEAAATARDAAAAAVLAANEGGDVAARRAAGAAYVAAQNQWAEERRAYWAARSIVTP